MSTRTVFVLALIAALSLTRTAETDVWDNQSITDNGATTRNEITHGFSQIHDLGVQPGGVPDEDWYLMTQEPYSSYEILCDGYSGDIPVNDTLQRVDVNGGRVRIGGEEWSARAYMEDQVLEPGTRVEVVKIEGATALVYE